jgi:hypothetical protein
MKLGDVPTTSEQPCTETVTAAYSLNNTVANLGALDLEYASYTMPWPGALAVDIIIQVAWAGYQQIIFQSVLSSPAPTYAPQRTVLLETFGAGTRAVVPGAVGWNSLGSGVVAHANLRMSVGGGGPSVRIDYATTNIRAWRTS